MRTTVAGNHDGSARGIMFTEEQIDMITPTVGGGGATMRSEGWDACKLNNAENELLRTQKNGMHDNETKKKNEEGIRPHADVAATAFSYSLYVSRFLSFFFVCLRTCKCSTCVSHDVICVIFHTKRKQRTE